VIRHTQHAAKQDDDAPNGKEGRDTKAYLATQRRQELLAHLLHGHGVDACVRVVCGVWVGRLRLS